MDSEKMYYSFILKRCISKDVFKFLNKVLFHYQQHKKILQLMKEHLRVFRGMDIDWSPLYG